MMELIRQWIIGITYAAAILALLEGLTPSGPVKKAGKLAGGMLLMLAVLRPLISLDYDSMAAALSSYRLSSAGYSQALELENRQLIKAIIEEETAAYISDKMEELGMDCTVEITYSYGEDGSAWPTQVTVTGQFTQAQRTTLSKFLEAELAIPIEGQHFERTAAQ